MATEKKKPAKKPTAPKAAPAPATTPAAICTPQNPYNPHGHGEDKASVHHLGAIDGVCPSCGTAGVTAANPEHVHGKAEQ